MGLLDSLEDHAVSPMKVAWNLASDVMTTGDIPSWDQITAAFSRNDHTALPKLDLVNKTQEDKLADTAMQFGSTSVSVTRVGDPSLALAAPPPAPSVSVLHPLTLWRSGG